MISIDIIGNSLIESFNHGEHGGHWEELLEKKGPNLLFQPFPRVPRAPRGCFLLQADNV